MNKTFFLILEILNQNELSSREIQIQRRKKESRIRKSVAALAAGTEIGITAGQYAMDPAARKGFSQTWKQSKIKALRAPVASGIAAVALEPVITRAAQKLEKIRQSRLTPQQKEWEKLHPIEAEKARRKRLAINTTIGGLISATGLTAGEYAANPNIRREFIKIWKSGKGRGILKNLSSKGKAMAIPSAAIAAGTLTSPLFNKGAEWLERRRQKKLQQKLKSSKG